MTPPGLLRNVSQIVLSDSYMTPPGTFNVKIRTYLLKYRLTDLTAILNFFEAAKMRN